MQIKRIESKNEWNKTLKKVKHTPFLQSFEWGELQSGLRKNIFLVVVDGENILAMASLIRKKVIITNYFYCPQGPVVLDRNNYFQIIQFFIKEIKTIAKKEKVSFLRFEPIEKLPVKNIKKTIDIEPRKTIILNLDNNEDILKKMHQKTRYNIKLSIRKGVKIEQCFVDDFDNFWALMKKTAERDKFRIHVKDHYQKLLTSSNNFIKVFVAKIDKKIIAGGIFSFFGDTTTYMHGCSDYKYRKLMAPYALQWYVIQFAKNNGYKYYDFYGIDDKKWPGVTRFKKGFNGSIVERLGTFDAIFDLKKYLLYSGLRKIRRFKFK